MKRAVSALFVLLLGLLAVTGPVTGAEAAPAPAPHAAGIPKVLRVGTEGVYAPFSYHDAQGNLTGFDIDVMNAIGKHLGVQVQYVETPWDSMFAALEAGRFDLEPTR